MNGSTLRHVLLAKQFTREWLTDFFPIAAEIKDKLTLPSEKRRLHERLLGRSAILFFGEKSTRTRASFNLATGNLGMFVVPVDSSNSSMEKAGESWEETMQVFCGYRPDVIVLRHDDDSSSEEAARISDERKGPPIINGGSGKKHHPTQALLDLFTIEEQLGHLDNLTVAIGADVFYSRTARSLAYLLSKYQNIRLIFVTPPELAPPLELLSHLAENRVACVQTEDMREAFRVADVVYWGRLQTERVLDLSLRAHLENRYANFSIGLEQAAVLQRHAIIMHPMPISSKGEISQEVKQTSSNYRVLEQSDNGLPVRMALLWELLKDR